MNGGTGIVVAAYRRSRTSFAVATVIGLCSSAPAARAQNPGDRKAPPSPISQTELVSRLSHGLDSLVQTGQFSGVVTLARDGSLVFHRAYGMADRGANRANDTETAFNIGSINKIFTQIAIMQLRDSGKIELDSTLAKYWPDYPNKEVARKVTIRQLLRHTSGIGGNIFAPPASGRRNDIRSLQDYLPLFVNTPMQFEPGTKNAYSNAGYVVLGLLVQRVSGEDYYTYVKSHILDPAGMKRTASYAVDSLPPNTAIGYSTGGPGATSHGPISPNTAELPGRGSSAGGGYSTSDDLVAFIQALRTHRIPSGPPAGIGAAGGSGGLNADVEGDLPGGYDLVVLANLDPPAAERVATMVREWLGVKLEFTK